ncbi:MAG: hypothetical protein ABIR91_04970 [Candidatus Saccharimonadales bacterium]
MSELQQLKLDVDEMSYIPVENDTLDFASLQEYFTLKVEPAIIKGMGRSAIDGVDISNRSEYDQAA